MTSKFISAFVAAFVVTTAALRAATVPPNVQMAIAADYQLGCTAALDPSDANLAAAFAFLSPDYVDTDIKGQKYTREQSVAQGTQGMKSLHTTVCEPTLVSSTLNGDRTITAVEQVHLIGTVQANSGTHDLDVTVKAQDTWKQLNGTWIQTSSQELRNLVKMDGNVVQDEGQ
ncbi:MAG: hypothetical protein WBD74_03415 [Candidatus Aquilonibacter sp.]